MAKHRSYTGEWCGGAGMTPVPVSVREPDFTPAGLHDGRTLDRWDFLSLPLLVLLHIARAEVREVADAGFIGSVHATAGGSPWRWIVHMPIGGDALEHDLTVRGLLATAHGIDVGDWPLDMALRSA